MTTDRELALAVRKAWAAYDASDPDTVEDIVLAENAVFERLDLPLDETERGATPWAMDMLEEFVGRDYEEV